MIARVWKGLAKPERLTDYAAHLRAAVLPELEKLQGFQGLKLMHRQLAEGVEVVVTTLWDSLGSIKAFAGDDLERAVVAPEAQAMFLRYEARVAHYEVAIQPGS